MKRQLYWFLTFLIFLLFFPFFSSFAASVDLPKTGQTNCYDINGVQIECSGTGQDGEFQAGVEWPNPRFTDNNNGTVTDKLTGLMWVTDVSVIGSVTWQESLDFVKNLNTSMYQGYTDWHLPNIHELYSLYNFSSSTFPMLPFTTSLVPGSWSSTTWIGTAAAAFWAGFYSVNSYGGFTSALFKDGKTTAVPVRYAGGDVTGAITLPRTGQVTCYDAGGASIPCEGTGQDGDIQAGEQWPMPRFIDNGDGTVTDKLTNLMWTKSWVSGGVTWQGALDSVSNLNVGDGTFGYRDWRLPNIVELLSLSDHSVYWPWAGVNAPFRILYNQYYWSSTTLESDTAKAFRVWSNTGDPNVQGKSSTGRVFAVRGGKIGGSLPQKNIVVHVVGSSGKVTSSPSGIDCPTTCNASFPGATAVQLDAEAAPGSVFIGWDYPGCSPKSTTCPVVLNTENTVTVEARFAPLLTADDPKIIFVGICGAGRWGNECSNNEGWFDPRLSNIYNGDNPLNPLNWDALTAIGETDSGIIAAGLRVGTQFPNSVVTIASFDVVSSVVPRDLKANLILENQILPFYNPGDQIVLMGHSWGAQVIGDVAEKLNNKKIPVRMAGWIDAFGILKIKIPNNVKKAFNFYYPRSRDNLCPLAGASKITINKKSTTDVSNQSINNPPPVGPDEGELCSGHRNMDNDKRVWVPMLSYILESSL